MRHHEKTLTFCRTRKITFSEVAKITETSPPKTKINTTELDVNASLALYRLDISSNNKVLSIFVGAFPLSDAELEHSFETISSSKKDTVSLLEIVYCLKKLHLLGLEIILQLLLAYLRYFLHDLLLEILDHLQSYLLKPN